MIDVQRLINDPDYWNEVAPEGAEFYAQEGSGYHEGWYRLDCGGWYFCVEQHRQPKSIVRTESPDWTQTMLSPTNDRTLYKKPTRMSISYNENPYEESKTAFEEVANLCKQTNITLMFNESLSELGTYTIIDNDFERTLVTGNIKTVLTVLKKKKAFVDEMNNWEWVE